MSAGTSRDRATSLRAGSHEAGRGAMTTILRVDVVVTSPGRNYVAVKINTSDDGLYGWGDATLNGRELAVASYLRDHLAPILVGRQVERIEDTWQYLTRGGYWRGGPVQMTAVSGIDMALWDIKGKVTGQPVHSLLGGACRDRLLAYGHASGRDIPSLIDDVRRRLDEGFKVVRVQGATQSGKDTYGVEEPSLPVSVGQGGGVAGGLPRRELDWEPEAYLRFVPRMLEALRDEFGDDVEFCHDVHSRLTPTQAAGLAREIEPFHLFFLEDPVRPENPDALRRIRSLSTTPIAQGELFTSRFDCLPLITEQLVDFLRCDLAHIGGISEARRIATLAEPYGIRTAWHGPADIGPPAHAASVHVGFATPNFGIQEYHGIGELAREVFPGVPSLKDGHYELSHEPGLGTDVHESLASKYPYQRAYLPTVTRADGAVHDW